MVLRPGTLSRNSKKSGVSADQSQSLNAPKARAKGDITAVQAASAGTGLIMTAGERLTRGQRPLLGQQGNKLSRPESARRSKRRPVIESMGKGLAGTTTGTIISLTMAIGIATGRDSPRLKLRLPRRMAPIRDRLATRSSAASHRIRGTASARMIAAVTRGLLVRRAGSPSQQAPRRSAHPVV
jgi:hypothetical protein